MRLIDADNLKKELTEQLLPKLEEKYRITEALHGLHFSYTNIINNLESQPTATGDFMPRYDFVTDKYIPVIDGEPDSREKGLRIKVKSVVLDEKNNLLAIKFYYSGYDESGVCMVDIDQQNKVILPEE